MRKQNQFKQTIDKKVNLNLDPKIRKTLNQCGYAIETLDEFSDAFIKAAVASKDAEEYCLEVGAAFGFVTINALSKGAKIIANDVDARHLQAIKDNTPKEFNRNLKLLQGRFPKEVSLKQETIANVLLCRVTHYLTPGEMDTTISVLYKLLKSGGKVFLVSESPYGVAFKKFIPIYEQRIRNKTIRWPGFIEDLPKYMQHFSEDNPNTMLLLGENELRKEFEKIGFIVESCNYFSRSGVFPPELCLDGRESVGLIARKP